MRAGGSFVDWTAAHERLAAYLTLLRPSFAGSPAFAAQRQQIHDRIAADLRAFAAALETRGQRQLAQLTATEVSASQLPAPAAFAAPRDALRCRELAFLRDLLLSASADFTSRSLFRIMERQKDVDDLLWLLQSGALDSDKVCYVSAAFFSVEHQCSALTFELPRIQSAYAAAKRAVDSAALRCVTTDFMQFFTAVVRAYEDSMDPRIAYSRVIPFEGELKHFIEGNHADEISVMLGADRVDLPECIYDTVLRIHPKWRSLSQNQIAISKLIFFIAIYEIVYAKRNDMDQSSPAESYRLLFRKANLSYKTLHLPEFLKSNGEVDDSTSIRDFFLGQSCFDEARNEMLNIIFASNPFDMLFHFHNVISSVNSLAREYQKKTNQKNYMIAFDDLFVLLYGIFLSSDLPDIFYTSKVIDMYLKRFHLCSFFEYAKSTIEALVIYLKTP